MDIFDSLHVDGQTILIVTHEEDIAARCHRIVRLRDGLIETDERTARGQSGAAARALQNNGGPVTTA
jgi:putative ABC transport system ATP-binding protein